MTLRVVPQPSTVAFFDTHVPNDLLREIARRVLLAYPEAENVCEGLAGWEEIHDLRAHLRRALVETSLTTLHGRFGETVVRTPSNATGSAYHKEVSHGPVVLTVTMVAHRGSNLPDAKFRETLARSNQLTAFDEPPAPAPDAQLWGAVIHGPRRDTHRIPGFLWVVFPIHDGSHSGGIDVLARFPELLTISDLQAAIAPRVTVRVERAETPPEPTPTIRPGIIREEERDAE